MQPRGDVVRAIGKRITGQRAGAIARGATFTAHREHVQVRDAGDWLSPADEGAIVGIERVIRGWIDCGAGLLRHRAAAAVVHGYTVVAGTCRDERGGAVEVDRNGRCAGNTAGGWIAGDVVEQGGVVDPDVKRRLAECGTRGRRQGTGGAGGGCRGGIGGVVETAVGDVVGLAAAAVAGRRVGREIAGVGRALRGERSVRFAVRNGTGKIDDAGRDQRRVDNGDVVTVDDRSIGGTVGVGAKDVQVIRLTLHDGDTDAGVSRGAHGAEVRRRTRGDHVAVDVEDLDVQIAAGGQEGGVEQIEINLEVERAGVLSDDTVIILISRNAGEFGIGWEDRRVLCVDGCARAKEVSVGRSFVGFESIRAKLEEIGESGR